MQELIFATGNQHKFSEVFQVIDKSKYDLKSLKDLDFTEDIEETGSTLEENALLKARFIADRFHTNVFSEDTGLEVDALDGAPGVYTARYGGPEKDAHQNMDFLLKNLNGHTNRAAQFRAIIALIIDGQEVLFEGIIRGTIALKKSGHEGFGYDPIFIPEGYDKSFAELPDEVKLSLSHRSRAVSKMVTFLESLSIPLAFVLAAVSSSFDFEYICNSTTMEKTPQFFLYTIVISTLLTACSPTAVYHYHQNNVKATLKLYPTNRYAYRENHAGESMVAKGNYFLNDSLLSLQYPTDVNPPFRPKSYSLIKTPQQETATGQKISVVDIDTYEPLAYATIAFYDASKRLITGRETDLKGVTNSPSLKNVAKIEVSYAGYQLTVVDAQDVIGYDFRVALLEQQQHHDDCFSTYTPYTLVAKINDEGLLLRGRQFEDR